VAVVGASDWAMEEAVFLSRFASRLYLVMKPKALKASSDHRKELLAHPNVEVLGGAEPVEILGDGGGTTGLRVRIDAETRDIAVDGVFIFSGKRSPGTDFLKGVLTLDSDGYVPVNEACESAVPGLYAVGDVRRSRFHQVATAVGDGAVAGMDALRHFRVPTADAPDAP
jgi:thioredoxin reductase (NADPH)